MVLSASSRVGYVGYLATTVADVVIVP